MEANARTAEERKRRKLTLALAASVIGTIIVVGGGWFWNERERRERAGRVELALREAEVLHDQAKQAGDDLARWAAARDAAHSIELLLADARDERTRRRVKELARTVTAAAAAAQDDRKLLDKLINIRLAKSDDPDGSATDAAYAAAFREAGIDVAELQPAQAGAKVKTRPAAVAVSVAAALDYWAVMGRGFRRDRAGAERLVQVARAADADPWRNQLRDALGVPEAPKRLEALHALVGSAKIDELPPISLDLLGTALSGAGDHSLAESMLRKAQRRHPGDLWLNYNLAWCLRRLGRTEEAIRYYTAARSIRPETAHALAHALQEKGESDEAIEVFRDSARRNTRNRQDLICLVQLLQAQGRNAEASVALDEAIASIRENIRRRPADADAYFDLGRAQQIQGMPTEAIHAFRESIKLKPNVAMAHGNLAGILNSKGDLDGAIGEYRQAIRLVPDLAEFHISLGNVLLTQGKQDAAIAEFREAIRLKSDDVWAHVGLGAALLKQGKIDVGFAAYREATRLQPNNAAAHEALGVALAEHGKLSEAIAEYRHATRLNPKQTSAHNNLGYALRKHGNGAEAMAEYREAIRLQPNEPWTHNNLGLALADERKWAEAAAEYREAIRLKPDECDYHENLGWALRQQGKTSDALAELREALRLDPKDASSHNVLGALLCDGKHDYDGAILEFREAIRLDPNDADAHSNLGSALSNKGNFDEAIVAFREAIRLEPDDAHAQVNLGNTLRKQGKLHGAIAAYREAIRLKPGDAAAHGRLGQLLADEGKLFEAIAEFREAIRLQPDSASSHSDLGAILCDRIRDYVGATAEFREAIRLQPDLPGAHYNLGNALQAQGKSAEAIAALREAIRLKPDHPEAHCNLAQRLQSQGLYNEALAEFRRGHELGSKQADWRYPSAQWVRDCEQMVSLAAKLPAILKGDVQPADPAQRIAIASMCYDKQLNATAVRFLTEAFQADSKLADDMEAGNRYNAACSAALAGVGKSKDEPPPSEAAKAKLRQQALIWLTDDLASWIKQLASGSSQSKASANQMLQHWKIDPDLAGIRDDEALNRLPEKEREALRSLWAEVETTLKRAGA